MAAPAGDQFREIKVGIARILEEFRQFDRHFLGFKKQLFEERCMKCHDLLKVVTKVVHHGAVTDMIGNGMFLKTKSAHSSTASNFERSSQNPSTRNSTAASDAGEMAL